MHIAIDSGFVERLSGASLYFNTSPCAANL
jgi:hypothetical protein